MNKHLQYKHFKVLGAEVLFPQTRAIFIAGRLGLDIER